MTRLAALLLVVPLTSEANWQVLKYRGIPPHEVRFEANGLRIDVNASAAPIVHRLDEVVRVRNDRSPLPPSGSAPTATIRGRGSS